MSKTIKGYKGFDPNMKCRGYQYEEGKEYIHEGSAVACMSGFHFCENPLDVFGYYEPGGSVFCVVEGAGEISKHNNNSKVACTKIKIGSKLSLHDLIGDSIKFLFSREYDKATSSHAEGDSSAASATGDYSAASATGDYSAASATGGRSAASATGYWSAASATGDYSAASATGDGSAASATGDGSAASATGLGSKAMAGKYGCIALAWWNEEESRAEMRCAETGCGDGSDGKLKAEVWYRLNKHGEFEEE